MESKLPIITGLATNSALTAVENKIHDVSGVVKKKKQIIIQKLVKLLVMVNQKVSNDNHDKYITTPEFNNLAAEVFTTRLAQANLVTKTDFDTKLQSLNKKITSNKTKHLLVENELKKTAKI